MKPNITIQGLRKTGFKVIVIHSFDTTTIFVTDTKGNTSMGQSICHEGDCYNRKLGNKIALGRALKALEKGEIIYGFNHINYLER